MSAGFSVAGERGQKYAVTLLGIDSRRSMRPILVQPPLSKSLSAALDSVYDAIELLQTRVLLFSLSRVREPQ